MSDVFKATGLAGTSVMSSHGDVSGRDSLKISTPVFVNEQRPLKASMKMVIIGKWLGWVGVSGEQPQACG